jgi:hypothetical protein
MRREQARLINHVEQLARLLGKTGERVGIQNARLAGAQSEAHTTPQGIADPGSRSHQNRGSSGICQLLSEGLVVGEGCHHHRGQLIRISAQGRLGAHDRHRPRSGAKRRSGGEPRRSR